MNYRVVIAAQGSDHFVAMVPDLPGCSAEGRSREQALVNVRASIKEMLDRVDVVQVSVDPPVQAASSDPWLAVVGQFREDSAFDPMMQEIYRERSGDYPE